MVEVVDKDTNQKMIAMIICSICYNGGCYIIYTIRREKEDANVFVSKLIRNSQGYIMDHDFENGEKEVLENIVQRFFNRESKEVLESDGFSILDNVELNDKNYFDIKKCYISTVSKELIKNCLIHYGLVSSKMFEQPIIEVIEDKRKFNEGFVSNVVLIVFGIFILCFSIFVIWGVLFG